MTDTDLDQLRFPIGRFELPAAIGPADREAFIDRIEATPVHMRRAVEGLDDAQLDTPYRPGGWNARQVVHHVVDSHLNSYIRFKWALTEEAPHIKVYDQDGWAQLEDSTSAPVEMSLAFLDALHERWVFLLRRMSGEDFDRTFVHPEWAEVRLDQTLAIYAWHGDHHVAHITALREREGW